MKIVISQSLLDAIHQHGQMSYPEEGAGIIMGTVLPEMRTARVILPLTNQANAKSRHNRFLIEAKDMLTAELEADKVGLEIIGVFHSHPNHPPQPSEFDLQWALPWYSYLITRVERDGAVATKSWRLNDDRQDFSPEIVEVTQSNLVEELS